MRPHFELPFVWRVSDNETLQLANNILSDENSQMKALIQYSSIGFTIEPLNGRPRLIHDFTMQKYSPSDLHTNSIEYSETRRYTKYTMVIPNYYPKFNSACWAGWHELDTFFNLAWLVCCATDYDEPTREFERLYKFENISFQGFACLVALGRWASKSRLVKKRRSEHCTLARLEKWLKFERTSHFKNKKQRNYCMNCT